MTVNAAIAANRFGLGARPGDLDVIERVGARAWLSRQLSGPESVATPEKLPSSAALLSEMAEGKRRGDFVNGVMRNRMGETYQVELAWRLRHAVATEASFRERLVWFWSNYFAVSVRGGARVRGLAGAFEREAIRPNVTGKFRDLLRAAVLHPAMLTYLDNLRSVGPNSPVGLRKRRGFNENLAREVLELHTIGVNAGYAQTDVEEFALALTGWGGDAAGRFNPVLHEPGPRTVLGTHYADAGATQAYWILRDLARHPATVNRVSFALCRHFIADAPPPEVVERLERRFMESDGDLVGVCDALIDAEEAWDPARRKLKRPDELVLSAGRALEFSKDDVGLMAQALRRFGQMPFAAPSPAGYADVAGSWAGPGAVLERAEWCAGIAAEVRTTSTPIELALAVLGPDIGPATQEALRKAPSRPEGVALLLASPEFQRR